MRAGVEADQEIGRLHAQMLTASTPDAAPSPDPEALTASSSGRSTAPKPDYAGVPDSSFDPSRRVTGPHRPS